MAVFAQQTIVLSTIQRNPISTPDNKGMADLIAIEAFKRAGVKLEIDDIPAKRALINANHGIHDGDLARVAGVTKNYPNLLPVPEVTWIAEIGGFSKQKNTILNGWESLDPFHLAYIRGWVIFERNIKTSKSLTQVNDPETLFNLLDKNRTDIALYEKKMGFGVIAKLGLTGIYNLSQPLTVEPIYIYLHKKHQALIPKVANAIRAMKRDGSYQIIVRKALKNILPDEDIEKIIGEVKID
jgi:polar amino acid transport system substrate-binding protein